MNADDDVTGAGGDACGIDTGPGGDGFDKARYGDDIDRGRSDRGFFDTGLGDRWGNGCDIGYYDDMGLGDHNDYVPGMAEEVDMDGVADIDNDNDMNMNVDMDIHPPLLYHSEVPFLPSAAADHPVTTTAMSPVRTVLPPRSRSRVFPQHLRWDDNADAGVDVDEVDGDGINPSGGILPLSSVPSSSFARQQFEPYNPRLLQPPPPHHAIYAPVPASVSVPIPLVILSPSRRGTSSSRSPSHQQQRVSSSGIMPSSSSLIDRSVIDDRDESGVGLITLLPAFATKATGTRNNEAFWDSLLLS